MLVVGFQDVPQAGDHFIVTTEERYAKELSKFRQERLNNRNWQRVHEPRSKYPLFKDRGFGKGNPVFNH